jgi:glucosyl-dolichyl phosphate glucuronosyltransferase
VAPAVSIIVCTFNRADALERSLASIARARSAALTVEVLVVDNNCTDRTADVVASAARNLPELRRIVEPRQGLSFARNRGTEAAKHEYLLYLDDDALLPTGYFARLAALLRDHQPDLYGGPVRPLFEAPPPDWFDPSLELRQHAVVSGFSSSATISGPNFGIRRAVLDRIGPFATDLGMVGGRMAFGEDRELVERYRHLTPPAEQRLYYDLDLVVEHEAPAWKLTRDYQLRRAYETAVSRERVFVRTHVRSRLRSRILALGHLVLAPVFTLTTALAGGLSARARFMALRHAWVVAGRLRGVFGSPAP